MLNPQIERTIQHFYPHQSLISPLTDPSIRWRYDPEYAALKAALKDFEEMGAEPRPGTRGDFDISEEVILFGDLHLQLSYLGPWAAMGYQLGGPLSEELGTRAEDVEAVLQKHGIVVLDEQTLSHPAAWIAQKSDPSRVATVWSCLFVNEWAEAPLQPPQRPESVEQPYEWK